MTEPARFAAFAVTLVALVGGGVLAGGAIDPDRDEPRAAHGAGPDRLADGGHHTPEEAPMSPSASTEPAAGHGGGEHGADPVRGLAVAEDGLRLVVDDPELRRGRTETLRFRIVDGADETMRRFDVEHEKRMHLILARRDLTGFQHLHPVQQADGSWTVDVRLDHAGSYRLFADFSRGGEAHTLAGDLRVDGRADLRPLPAPAPVAVSDGGLDVRLDAVRARPGEAAELRFTVSRDGRTVHTEPYLGAGGHLVALREGDLAFLHVHPAERGHDEAAAEHDDAVGFAATFPSRGRYRLFLQVKHEGRVHTVAFTQEVA